MKSKWMFFLILIFLLAFPIAGFAAPLPFPSLELGITNADSPQDIALSLQLLAILTILSLAPAILILMTSFTRIIVVLSFVRHALATQQMPPNQVLVSLALFLTFFIMAPVWADVNQNALQPYLDGTIDQTQAFDKALAPIRDFMFEHTRKADLALFVELAGLDKPEVKGDIPTYVLIPSFAISELKTAFQIGFLIFIPFIVIDMVVASTLMSMGMLMVPPMMISLPFKLLLFVLVDGWQLIVKSLVLSF
ncbi:MAG: flagellar type III secretion system pore protein FliP [Peptococcales bacterium]|jgi:flagellar biosynthetic protein FliP